MKHARDPVGRHRHVEPGRRRAQPPTGRHRGPVRPRYGRIALVVSAVTVTAVGVLGTIGVLGNDPDPALAAASAGRDVGSQQDLAQSDDGTTRHPARERTTTTKDESDATADPTATPDSTADVPLPPASGSGRRIVFSESQQRIWLVDGTGSVLRTYLGSGSVYDNLDPGSYEVYSKSRYAVGVDDSGTMQYFVRFTQGDEGAAIGFHSIPVLDGQPVQTRAELGTPESHGCIRQALPDAIALWNFAPIGTTVVVTA
ncbi:L,D-transpeptidase [Nocardioides panacisoli]|uniref:L,D-TPase catalytic domain-containing protein n=1 Tax=Nocardioides panacisoli TaxID=627624 RepID=A0ABP7IT03_9ACTN